MTSHFCASRGLTTENVMVMFYQVAPLGIGTGMLNLLVLMYMQNPVIMAGNEYDMQMNLNQLNDYCNCNKLKVNIRDSQLLPPNCRWKTMTCFITSNKIKQDLTRLPSREKTSDGSRQGSYLLIESLLILSQV